mmetsp:Transcript_5235/g.6958  ORF Transcript_5235/g.6958 Transcript_5235/m.6958 type:complete len:106 (-) Transcript_5235:427-744(-)
MEQPPTRVDHASTRSEAMRYKSATGIFGMRGGSLELFSCALIIRSNPSVCLGNQGNIERLKSGFDQISLEPYYYEGQRTPEFLIIANAQWAPVACPFLDDYASVG